LELFQIHEKEDELDNILSLVENWVGTKYCYETLSGNATGLLKFLWTQMFKKTNFSPVGEQGRLWLRD
jgi:hypothetical protein